MLVSSRPESSREAPIVGTSVDVEEEKEKYSASIVGPICSPQNVCGARRLSSDRIQSATDPNKSLIQSYIHRYQLQYAYFLIH